MEKEVGLKKIELKVSVNCCEGCKKKIKKALGSTEGVFKTDINPLQPKVTVLGKVNPKVLIKKLLKVGKHAELCSYEELNAENKYAAAKEEATEKNDADKIEKERHIKGRKQEKQPHGCDVRIEKTHDITGEDEGKNKVSNKDNMVPNMTTDASNSFRRMKGEYPPLHHPELDVTVHPSMHLYSNMRTHPMYCYIAQPCAVAVPYYAVPSHPATPLPPACAEEYYHFDRPSFQPPFLRPTVKVGDYFSDENTMGCHVM